MIRNTTTFRRITIYLLMIFGSYAAATASLTNSNKLIAIFLLLSILSPIIIKSSPFTKLWIVMLAITLPVTLRFGGKDALTTGTIAILSLFIWNRSKITPHINIKISQDYILKSIVIIILISFIGTISGTPSGYIGTAIRHLLNFISSGILFLTVVQFGDVSGFKNREEEYIEKLITLILVLVLMLVLLSLLVYYNPNFENLFSIFFHRKQTDFAGATHSRNVARLASVLFGAEQFGELIAVVYPFALYKILSTQGLYKKIFQALIIILVGGAILTGTRSINLLIILSTFFIFFTNINYKYKKKILAIIISLTIILFFAIFFYPTLLGNPLIVRTVQTINNIEVDNSTIAILNRNTVWSRMWTVTMDTLSFFGNGPTQAARLGLTRYNFHCLYVTLIFQFGIIGSLLFFYFFYMMFNRLVSIYKKNINIKTKLLSISCISSFTIFLINEIKFEFNRGDSYQQIIFFIFSIYYLSGKLYSIQTNYNSSLN